MRHVVATVAPWQHASPHGGFVSTAFVRAANLEPGMVVDHRDGYCPLVAVWSDVRTRLTVAAIELPDGRLDHRVFGVCEGVQVRRDMRWAPLPISRCGCWASATGRWTCDKHLRRRELRRRAAFRPRTTRPLWHLAAAERRDHARAL